MTEELLATLRKTCNDAPPRIDGRRVSLDPKTVIALLDEIETLSVQRDAMKGVVDALEKHERQYLTASTLRNAIQMYRSAMLSIPAKTR
jgi:hypothetical protein